MILFPQSKKYYGYGWSAIEGVILYSNNINYAELTIQFTYAIFEIGYGCALSNSLLQVFSPKSEVIINQKNVEIYRKLHSNSTAPAG